jgi:hypothetical protein
LAAASISARVNRTAFACLSNNRLRKWRHFDISQARSGRTAKSGSARGAIGEEYPIVGDAVLNAIGKMTDQLGNATGAIAKQYCDGSGPSAAGDIGRSIQGAGDGGRRRIASAHQRNIDATNEAIATHVGNALDRPAMLWAISIRRTWGRR